MRTVILAGGLGTRLAEETRVRPIRSCAPRSRTTASSASASVALHTARNYRNVIARPLAVVDGRLSAPNLPRERSPNHLPRQGPRP